jgi:hypothetical protein
MPPDKERLCPVRARISFCRRQSHGQQKGMMKRSGFSDQQIAYVLR